MITAICILIYVLFSYWIHRHILAKLNQIEPCNLDGFLIFLWLASPVLWFVTGHVLLAVLANKMGLMTKLYDWITKQ
jgi:hypothetical protein